MSNNKGFTLIEMLVVIAIIGLLSSVVVIGLGGSRKKARDARRVADVQQIGNWAELNYTATGYSSGTLPIAADPQGSAYSAEGAGTQTFKIGICLETGDQDTGNTDCPSGVGTCTSGYYYCTELGG